MITVKQYAEERGITIQAVHQSMTSKRKKEKLAGHIQVIEGVKWLDEEAVNILDEYRNKNAVVVIQQNKDEEIHRLTEENKALLVKIAEQGAKIGEQGARIGELSDWKAEKAMEIAIAAQTKLLLEAAHADVETLRTELEVARRKAAVAEKKLSAVKKMNPLQRMFLKGAREL